MIERLRRALRQLARGHYTPGPPMIRPTERRIRAAEALKHTDPRHKYYYMLADYASGELTLESIAVKHSCSESTLNRTINAMLH